MKRTVESLIAFERRVADAFAGKQIRSPVHLCSEGQAAHLIAIFQDVDEDDWICCTWRNHFHCLLKGMPEDELFDEIVAGRSMSICSRFHRIITSSIVGGVLPIACGLAMGAKMQGLPESVWAFCGDMCSYSGIYHETRDYAASQGLPLKLVIEDNGLSTDTPTEEAWGRAKWIAMRRYRYNRTWPHVGIGQHVAF